jgi:hypothetical protein
MNPNEMKKATTAPATTAPATAPATAKPSITPSQIKADMPVVCSKDGQFGVVDHIQGPTNIKLKKDDKGVHHYIPLAWVTRVDAKVHVDRPGEQVMREWATEPPKN